jgi:2-methylaconitate cis-trans-isomerase PrpF
MKSHTISAVFMRGGTSKALMFHLRDLPAEHAKWDQIFLAAMGSPDPYGRQLDGMGGGVSSLSKVCVIAPTARDDADVEYTFAQVLVKEPRVDYAGNCGNMLSAVGPFAVDEGLMSAASEHAMVRIYNTNTRKIIHSSFPVDKGRASYDGDFVIPGVAGSGAPIRLDFLEPGGATTGRLLPTGHLKDQLSVPGLGHLEVSMVDAANACVFFRAADAGFTGRELPDELERNPRLLGILQAIRVEASIAMGIAKNPQRAKEISAVPYVCFVSGPSDSPTLLGDPICASQVDLTIRVMSSGQPHRALPLTASLCTAVAAKIRGTVVSDLSTCPPAGNKSVRLGMPSGILPVDAEVEWTGEQWHARLGTFYRTARRLFDGRLYVPSYHNGRGLRTISCCHKQ